MFKHCPIFKSPKSEGEQRASPMAQLKEVNAQLQQENYQLKKREDGDLFKPTDSAHDIAVVIAAKLNDHKLKSLIEELQAQLKHRRERIKRALHPTE